jgi:putative DNA primase/helicase
MSALAVDRDQLGRFVNAMFCHADEGTFASLRVFLELEEGRPPAISAVRLNGNGDALTEAAVRQAQLAADLEKPSVFAPPVATFVDPKRAREIDLANGLALSVELDQDAARSRKRLEFLIGPATAVVASGGTWTDPKTGEVQDKLHIHWRLKEPTTTPEAHARLKKARTIATALVGGDCTNKPIVHPIRWPGTWHRKAEPKLCRLIELRPDAEIDLQDALGILLDIQPEFRGEGARSAHGGDPGDDRETAELARRVLTGEELHGALRDLAWRYLKGGMAQAQVVLTLRGLMDATTAPKDQRWQHRRDQIPMLVRTAAEKIGQPEPEDETFNQVDGDGAWPEPEPLPGGLPAVEPFPLDLLPAELRPWIEDAADRSQAPVDYLAVGAMVALGSLLGRQIAFRPKRHDDWTIAANLWGAVVGPPSVLKTPALEEALRHVKAMEVEAKQRHDEACELWKARCEVEHEVKKIRGETIKKRLKDKQDPSAIARDLVSDGNGEPPQPTRQRFITNDSSVEKMGELLSQNPNGMLLFRDEVMGWLRSLDKEGSETARAFFLEAWNGTGRFTSDRIGRGTIDIEAACVSVLGGIQPGPLLAYLGSQAWEGAGADGLLQRFQMVVWPDIARAWRNVDRWPNSDARKRARAVFARFRNIGDALPIPEGEQRPVLRFTSEAQAAFDDWRQKHERRLRAGDLHPAVEAHLAKYRSLLPTLALICHLADHGASPVGLEALIRGEAWIEYLETHAMRIYDALVRSDQTAARALGEHIKDLPSPFSLRDVYRPCWAGLTSKEAAQEAVDTLCELGWLRGDQKKAGKPGGRPVMLYHVNPAVGGGHASA